MSGDYRLSRRDALKYAGAGLAATTLLGSAAAHSGAVDGDAEHVGNGAAHAYVEYANGRGKLSALGVHLTAGVLENLPEKPADWPPAPLPPETPFGVEYHLDLPRGNTGHFSYATLDWNPEGHEPPGLYDHPHFDFHFYLPRGSEIAGIPPGVATYDIQDAVLPANTYTADSLPAPLPSGPRGVVPAMGEHLVSVPTSLPASPGDDGWSVFIWGAYDLDGDGEGRVIFMEPMVTVAYLESLADGDEARTRIPMPERFTNGGWYPTEFVVRREGDDYDVALETFAYFPGYGR